VDLVDHDFPRKPKVLVVDDDWLNRDVLATYFVHMGADVQSAADGFKALEIATNDPPDLVMMDMAMPRMDGIEACRYLKSHPATQFVPVVIVTAMESDETRTRALAAGAMTSSPSPTSTLLMTRARALLKIKHLTDKLNQRTALLASAQPYVVEEVADAICLILSTGCSWGRTRTVTVLFADIRASRLHRGAHGGRAVDCSTGCSAATKVVFSTRHLRQVPGRRHLAFYGAPLASPTTRCGRRRRRWRCRRFQGLRAELPLLARLGLGVGCTQARPRWATLARKR
jgi:CheY-like chemotaxis protein